MIALEFAYPGLRIKNAPDAFVSSAFFSFYINLRINLLYA